MRAKMIPDLFERGLAPCKVCLRDPGFRAGIHAGCDKCSRPYTSRLTPGSEWVVGHHECGILNGSHTDMETGERYGGECDCGYAGLRVYDLPAGELGRVFSGCIQRGLSGGFIGISTRATNDSPEDAVWRAAWERLLRQDTTPLGKRYVVAKQIPDGLVVLSGPGITWRGIEPHLSRIPPSEWQSRMDLSGATVARFNPHNLTEPTLLRVAERELSPIGPLFTSAWDCSPLNALSDHFNRFDHHALLFERGGTDAVARGDLENLRVARRELLP